MAYVGEKPYPIHDGGTGQSQLPTNGQLLIGDSITSGFNLANLTSGSGISISNAPGSITIASTVAPPVLTPVFIARLTSIQSNVTGDATNYTPIIFDAADSNVGTAYNVATGIFTAPSAFDYCFAFGITVTGILNTHTLMDFKITTSTGRTAHGFYGNPYVYAVGGKIQIAQYVSIVMALGETAQVSLTVSNGTKVVDVFGDNSGSYDTWFAGYMLAGNSGSASNLDALVDGSGNTVSPTGGLITFVDGNNVSSLSGSASHITLNLTGTTNHAVQVGNASGSLTSLGLGSSGQPLLSGGMGSDPSYGTLAVANGGTSLNTLTDHSVLLGQGTSAIGFAGPSATTGLALTSNGLLSDPSFALLTVPAGGTGVSTLTNNAVLIGQGSSAIASVGPGASGLPLVGQGAGAPIFAILDVPGGGTGSNSLTGILTGNGASPITASAVSQYSTLVADVSNAVVGVAPSATVGLVYASNGAAANPSFQSISGTFIWTDATNASYALAANNAYVTNRGAGVTYTLPASGVLGDMFKIVGKLGITTITPNANQQLLIGSASGTVGVTGTAVGISADDCITFVCITSGASSVYRASSFTGSWTLN